MIGFIFFLFLSPILICLCFNKKDDKRTDYPAKKLQLKLNMLGINNLIYINVVLGDEWNAGNLSYHLKSRPVWEGFVDREKLDQLKDYMCLDSICLRVKIDDTQLLILNI